MYLKTCDTSIAFTCKEIFNFFNIMVDSTNNILKALEEYEREKI